MSIYDYFSGNASPEDRAGLAGLAAMFNGALGDGSRPVNLGAALSAGALGMQQGRQQQQDRERELQALQQQAAMRALQMRAVQNDLQTQERTQGEQAAIQQAAQSAVGADGQFDQDTFLRNIRSVNALKALDFERQLAKAAPEYDTTPQVVNGLDGKPRLAQFSKTAPPRVLEGLLPREKAELVNLGGRSLALNLADVQPGQSFERTMTPGEVASNRLGWANNAIARGQLGIAGERLAIDRQEAATRAAAGKAPTEFQGKSAAFGARAAEADRIISDLQGKYSPARVNAKMSAQDLPLVGGISGAVANKLLSGEEQQAEQAQRDFVNAVLRQESGAAIGESEFLNARRQYFPQPGDSDATVKQKARNRALAVQGLNNNAGRAAFAAPAPAGGGWSITEVP